MVASLCNLEAKQLQIYILDTSKLVCVLQIEPPEFTKVVDDHFRV